MTRAEWDAMEPRERDAVVAEKVMGWKVTHRGRRVQPGVDRADPHVGGVPREVRGFTGNTDARSWIAQKCGHYTTTPDGMMAVVEKVGGMGSLWMGNAIAEDQSKPWGVHIVLAGRGLGYGGHILTQADTLPEAVCLAALVALGHMEAA